jgi:uncharacterized membrane protein
VHLLLGIDQRLDRLFFAPRFLISNAQTAARIDMYLNTFVNCNLIAGLGVSLLGHPGVN